MLALAAALVRQALRAPPALAVWVALEQRRPSQARQSPMRAAAVAVRLLPALVERAAAALAACLALQIQAALAAAAMARRVAALAALAAQALSS